MQSGVIDEVDQGGWEEWNETGMAEIQGFVCP
jgi:hypothetical protein